MNAIIACNVLPNHDGLMSLTVSSRNSHKFKTCQPLFHTDSGHYLLRVDLFNKKPEKRWKDLGRLTRNRLKATTGDHKGPANLLTSDAESIFMALGDEDNDEDNPGTEEQAAFP